jgi:hypothetical protein
VISAIVETETETLTVPLKDLKPKTNKDISTEQSSAQPQTQSQSPTPLTLQDIRTNAVTEYAKMKIKVDNDEAVLIDSDLTSQDNPDRWKLVYDVGDLVKVTKDFSGVTDTDDVYVILKKEYIADAVRDENPNGFLYTVTSVTNNNNKIDNWEGKDIYRAFRAA